MCADPVNLSARLLYGTLSPPAGLASLFEILYTVLSRCTSSVTVLRRVVGFCSFFFRSPVAGTLQNSYPLKAGSQLVVDISWLQLLN